MRLRGCLQRGVNMKWMLVAMLPIAAFCAQADEDYLYIGGASNESLLHFAFDAEDDCLCTEYEDFDSQSLSLFEMDERDASLIPWSSDRLASEDFTSFIEQRAHEINEEFDDAFAYELYDNRDLEPTFENVSKEKHHLFGRPKVVQSKPDAEEKRKSETKSQIMTNREPSEKKKKLAHK